MSDTFLVGLGARVRELREGAGFSQEGFAARAGLDRTTYARLERGAGNPTALVPARMAAALGVEPFRLLEGVPFDPEAVGAMPRRTRAGGRPGPAQPPRKGASSPSAPGSNARPGSKA